jgi:hypothetical protein
MMDSTEWQSIGDTFFIKGQLHEAIDAYQHALNYNPENLSIGIKIGLSFYKIGDEKQGAQYLAHYQISAIGQRLLQHSEIKQIFWPGLSDFTGKSPDKKTANIFFLSAILDYQMNADFVWGNTKKFVEKTIPNPEDLWVWITSHTFEEWARKKKEYGLHRFPQAHERVWKIGKKIIEEYDGDVRNIWMNKTPMAVQAEIFKLVSGGAIPRMIMGALLDTEQIPPCRLDVKPDIHVCTVLARTIFGSSEKLSEDEALEITREMAPEPENPWNLDDPLFALGRDICTAKTPDCSRCSLKDICAHYHGVHLKMDIFRE